MQYKRRYVDEYRIGDSDSFSVVRTARFIPRYLAVKSIYKSLNNWSIPKCCGLTEDLISERYIDDGDSRNAEELYDELQDKTVLFKYHYDRHLIEVTSNHSSDVSSLYLEWCANDRQRKACSFASPETIAQLMDTSTERQFGTRKVCKPEISDESAALAAHAMERWTSSGVHSHCSDEGVIRYVTTQAVYICSAANLLGGYQYYLYALFDDGMFYPVVVDVDHSGVWR